MLLKKSKKAKVKPSIKQKITVFIVLVTSALLFTSIGFFCYKTAQMTRVNAEESVRQVVVKNAKQLSVRFNSDFSRTTTLATGFGQILDFAPYTRDSAVISILRNVFLSDENLMGLWLHWDIEFIDKNYKYGRVRTLFYRHNEEVKLNIDTTDLDGYDPNGIYYQIKKTAKNYLTEPYFYSYDGLQHHSILELSLCSPIIYKDKMVGLVGNDVALSSFDESVREITPYKQSYAVLLSNDGVFISHPNKKYIGKNVFDIYNKGEGNVENLELIVKNGIPISYYRETVDGKEEFVCFEPIYIGDIGAPLMLGVVVDKAIIMAEVLQIYHTAFLILFIGIIVMLTLSLRIASKISKSIVIMTESIMKMASGAMEIDDNAKRTDSREIEEIRNALEKLREKRVIVAEFISEIAKGNFTTKMLAKGDIIAEGLMEMQDSLIKIKEEEDKRKAADDKQNWINNGLSMLNDTLRRTDKNFETHAYHVIKTLLEHVKGNQGTLFLAQHSGNIFEDDESTEYKAISAVAWGRRKKIETSYKKGESLIGRCVFEKDIIYMTEVPDDYINITSGLGQANPRTILLVPMVVKDLVFGVIEIASFDELQPHQIDFLCKAGDIIALSFINKQEADKTARLLEQTKQQANDLIQKEEELKQNLEEIEANNEEAHKYETEMRTMLEAVNKLLLFIDFDKDRKISYVNENTTLCFSLKEQAVGKTLTSLGLYSSYFKGMPDNKIWELLQNGSEVKTTRVYNIENRTVNLNEIYVPVFNKSNILQKVIWLAFESNQNVNT